MKTLLSILTLLAALWASPALADVGCGPSPSPGDDDDSADAAAMESTERPFSNTAAAGISLTLALIAGASLVRGREG